MKLVSGGSVQTNVRQGNDMELSNRRVQRQKNTHIKASSNHKMVKETKANSELWPTHNSELALKRCLTIYHCSCQKKGSGSGTNEQGMIRSCQSHVFGALLGMPQYPYSCGAGAGGSSTERALNHDHSFLTIETHLPKKQKKNYRLGHDEWQQFKDILPGVLIFWGTAFGLPL